jgi:DNA polymerase-3 subunit gamma/tau
METILAMMQILDQTIARLRYSMHARALAEVAFVRICTLADLQAIPSLIAQLKEEGSTPARTAPPASTAGRVAPVPPAPAKKKWEGVNESPLGSDQVQAAWENALGTVGGMLADCARNATLAIRGPNQLAAVFAPQYNFGKQYCERAENQSQLQGALSDLLGRAVRLQIAEGEGAQPAVAPVDRRRPPASRQRMAEKVTHPWVKRAAELFDAQVVWMEEPQGSDS